MKNKKIVSMIVMFSIFINIISGLHIDSYCTIYIEDFRNIFVGFFKVYRQDNDN